jgi:hypothetical protein
VDSCPCLIHTTISHPIFFSRIQHFYKSKPNSEYHIFDSSFLYNLHYVDYQSAKNWAKKVDVFQKHVLLMPMCTNLHWILYVVVNPHQCGKVLDNVTNGPVILCLDSLGKDVWELNHLSAISLRRNGQNPEIMLIWHFHFLRKTSHCSSPRVRYLFFLYFLVCTITNHQVPNKFSSNCCFSQKTRERLRLWCVCVSVYACYCSFISGFSRRNTFAKKRWMGKFR